MKKIKFGIMINSYRLEEWQYLIIQELLSHNVQLELCIIHDNKEQNEIPKKFQKLNTLKRFLSKNGLFFIYLRYFQKVSLVKKIDISNLKINELKVRTLNKGKYSQYFQKEDINKINQYNLDFILRFGFNIIRGEILNTPKYGIWSFHHDDESKYRGSPPSFWEVYYNEPVTGAILQRLTDTLDGGIILKRGEIKTTVSYAKNINNNLKQTISWPLKLCIDIKNGNIDKFFKEPSKTKAKIYFAPTNSEFVNFIFKTLCRGIYNKIARFLEKKFSDDIWKIGYVDNFNIDNFFQNKKIKKVTWLNDFNKNDFRADPFCLEYNNSLDILYEGYDYKISKGNLNVMSIDYKTNQIFVKKLLTEQYHLSFPFLFEFNSKHYCIPESYQLNCIQLFEYDIKEKSLIKICNIVENVKAVDTVIFFHDGLWWMFYALEGENVNEYLYLRYTDNIFSEWKEHPMNPVKQSPKSSRMAGKVFTYKDNLYRPAQNCSLTYGGGISICKIEILTTIDYEESLVLELDVKDISNVKNNNIKGIHTFNVCNDKLVIDAKTY